MPCRQCAPNGAARPAVFDVALVGAPGAEGYGLLLAVDVSSVLHSLLSQRWLPIILGNHGDACATVVSSGLGQDARQEARAERQCAGAWQTSPLRGFGHKQFSPSS